MSEPAFFAEVIDWFGDSSNWQGPTGIPSRLLEHITLSAIPLVLASAIALPAAMYVGHTRRFEFAIVTVANTGRAIPSYALLVIMVIFTGLGDLPILVALTLLGIPPILTNGYVAIQSVDADTIEAARGMGLTGRQILTGIEIPLGAPLIVTGLRIAALQIVATAGLAAIVAGGGLGRYVVDGLAVRDFPRVFAGAVLIALLAGLTEGLFSLAQRWAGSGRGERRGDRRLPAEQPPEPVARPAA